MTMNWYSQRLRALFHRDELDRELEDEIAAHLALKEHHLHAEGAPDPTRTARLHFGNPQAWRESTREAWTFSALENLWRDILFGLRLLRKDKLFTAVVLLTLTLGIGANASIFGLMNGLLWRTLPVREPESLVRIVLTNLPPTERSWSAGREVKLKERRQLTFPLYETLSRRQGLFNGIFGLAGNGFDAVESAGTPYRVRTSRVTGNYFHVLGVEPLLGRLLVPSDDVPGGPPGGWPAVISDGLWDKLFGRGPHALGAKLTVERIPFTVVGVAPPSFHGVQPGVDVELWMPLSAMEAIYPNFHWRTDRASWMLQTMARLRPGVTLAQAQAEFGGWARPLLDETRDPRLSGKDLEYHLAMRLEARTAEAGDSWLTLSYGRTLWILLAVVGAILLIAATNVANLLLARAAARRQEIAVRLAIGASAGRIRRQLLVESALLALGGMAGGVLFAKWMTAALQAAIAGSQSPVRLDTSLDFTVLGFLCLVLLVVALAAGWAPAWSASRVTMQDALRQRSATASAFRLRGALIVLQTALSFTLLGGACLMISSLRSLFRESTGFDAAQTVLLTPDLFNAGVSRDHQDRAYRNLLTEARRLHAVESASWTMTPPLSGGLSAFSVEVPGKSDLPPMQRLLFWHQVSDGYFSTLGIPLRAGSDFPSEGSLRRDMCIVSESAARRFFGSPQDAVGRRIKPGNLDWLQIVGVAADSKYQHIREAAPPTIYTPYWLESASPGMTLAVRYRGDQAPVLAALQKLFQTEAGRLPFVQVRTVAGSLSELVRTERLLTVLLAAFSAFALLISATGIAGLLAWSVQQRRKEIGIRLAMGAQPALIRRQIQTRGLLLAALGITLGALTSYWLRNAMDTLLFRVTSAAPWIWLTAAAVILAAALAATALPAWRASRLDPVDTLRLE